MAVRINYIVFGGKEKKGGAKDILAGVFTIDEARAAVAEQKPAWWQIAVVLDEGLRVVEESQPDAPARPAAAKS